MRIRYIPAMIMLAAGAITSIINIVNKVELLTGLKRLLLVLIIFYFIGLIVRSIAKKITLMKPKNADLEEEETQEQSEGEENKANA